MNKLISNDFLLACKSFFAHQVMNGYIPDDHEKTLLESEGLLNTNLRTLKEFLCRELLNNNSLTEEHKGLLIQALGYTFDEKLAGMYISVLKENLLSPVICHSCLIALNNLEMADFDFFSYENSLENAREFLKRLGE